MAHLPPPHCHFMCRLEPLVRGCCCDCTGPANTFGATPGLSSPTCSGYCGPGAPSQPGSTECPCPAGFVRYRDVNGTEGQDSCLSSYSSPNPDGVSWDAAAASCESDNTAGHLLTVAYTGHPTPSGTDILSLALRVARIETVWVGATVAPLAPEVAETTWQWVDSTNTSNLNCGVTGCGVWGPGNPLKYVPRPCFASVRPPCRHAVDDA